jgi:adenosylcobinamide-phosphate synthase
MELSGLWELPPLDALDWAAGPGGPILLLLALALDALIGDPRWLPHPVRLMGTLTKLADTRLNRPRRSEVDRIIRGLLAVVVVVGLCVAAGWAIGHFTRAFAYGWIVELAVVASLIAQRSLFDHVLKVARALRGGGLAAGRAAVAKIVGRDVAALDEHAVSRAAIESCAENYADGVVAPVFWYLVLGLPGLFAYKAINTMDSMIGHKSERHAAFGLVAARLDDAVNYVPARLAGLLLVAAALFTPGAAPLKALRVMLRDAAKHRSPNAGWPEAAVAGALDLALLGPRRYGTESIDDPWLGDGRARATATDIRRTLYLFALGCFLVAALVAVVAVLTQLRGA